LANKIADDSDSFDREGGCAIHLFGVVAGYNLDCLEQLSSASDHSLRVIRIGYDLVSELQPIFIPKILNHSKPKEKDK
jgi:hypothetical protein